MGTPRPGFEEFRNFLTDEEEHGQLCDIAVPDADRHAWKVFLEQVVPRYKYRYAVLSESSETAEPLPNDAARVLNQINSETGPWPKLSMELDGLDVQVQFYDQDWLELDLRRTDVTPERFALITDLMRSMGEALRHDVFITPEMRWYEGALVYECARGRFRRPRHGAGADGMVRQQVFAAVEQAMAPIREIARVSAPDVSTESPPLDVFALHTILDQIEREVHRHRELVLQDALTVEDRHAILNVSSLLRSITHPSANAPQADCRAGWWRELLAASLQLR